MAAPTQTVSVDQLAQVCGITSRRCQQLAKQGVVHKTSNGEYLFIQSVKGYISFLQGNSNQDGESSTAEQAATLKKWQIEKTRNESRRIELELLKEQNMTVHVETAQAAVAHCFATIKRANKKWLNRMHSKMPGLPISVVEDNQRELIELFNSFADLNIRN